MTQHNKGKVPGPFPLRSEKKNVHVVTHLPNESMIEPGFLRNDPLITTKAAEFTLPVFCSSINHIVTPAQAALGEPIYCGDG